MSATGFLNFAKRKSVQEKEVEWNLGEFLSLSASLGKSNNAMAEATYFACMKIMSESIGKLSFKIQQKTADGVRQATEHRFYDVVKRQPNPYMNASTFWATMELNRNHHGNGYALIKDFGSDTPTMWLLESPSVQPIVDDACLFGKKPDLWYIYSNPRTGEQQLFNRMQIFHVKTSNTFDGIVGKSVRQQLAETVAAGSKSMKVLNSLYDNNLNGKSLLTYTGSLSDENVKKAIKGLEAFAAADNSADARQFVPIPAGMGVTPLQMKMTDAQFLELRKYSALQIAAAFGIKPNQINDYEKSSYASAEAQSLAFYVETLMFPLKCYEDECESKIFIRDDIRAGYECKINVAAMLRVDTKAQLESITNAVSNGVYTPNEGRAFLDLPAKPGGDRLYVNGSNIPIELAGRQYNIRTEGGEKE